MTLNGEGDFEAFTAALITNVVSMIIFTIIFMVLRTKFPLMYSGNVLACKAPGTMKAKAKYQDAVFADGTPEEIEKAAGEDAELYDGYQPEWTLSSTGWWKAAWSYKLGPDFDIANVKGCLTLDQAMLLQFCNVGMKILGIVGVPMLLIMAPLHLMFGGNAAGADTMSYLSFGNVKSCGVDLETGEKLNPDFENCWLYNVHSVVIWFVVFTV